MSSSFFKSSVLAVLCATSLGLGSCAWQPPVTNEAYWQRVEENSALWMTGPKAQQELEQNISSCVREIDELVELDALRETTPPDTHSEYLRSLDDSGDLDYYDTPTRLGKHMVSHTDFHDFESCMRSKGWERVKYVRYQTALKAKNTYRDTRDIRKYGVSGDAVKAQQAKQREEMQADYALNN